MSLSQGWEQTGKVLRLTKSVYGLAQVPLAWFAKLFQSSQFDPYLLDNCIMFARDLEKIDEKIQHMVNLGFTLCVKKDATGFWGIDLECNDDGTIQLKQTALIECIIESIGFQNAKSKQTPAEVGELPADIDGPGPQKA
eukprot:6687674-Ditylum_brightwellii.AAC.1